MGPLLRALRRLAGDVPGVLPGSRSLQRHLLLWLLLPQLVLWAAAAWVTYNVAARYTNLAIDRSLYQTSRALARQIKPLGNGLLIDFPRAARDIIETDPDDRVYYMVSTPPGQFILGNNKMPAPPPGLDGSTGEPRFYDGEVDRVPVRVAALYLAWGDDEVPERMLVQVARSRASREALLARILTDTALPLSVLVALMSVIVWAGIRAGLAPLARLRDAVQGRAPNDLAPIEIERAPQEVRGLASAVNALLAAVQASVVGQRRFISDAAHQLRTPLAGLKAQSELAVAELDVLSAQLREPAAAQALRDRLARVQQSATRSAHLIGQLLVLARAEPESAAVMGRSRFDLAHLGRELATEWVPRALQAGVDLGYDGPPGEAPLNVEGNALLVREALGNVLDNAVRYAGRGSDVTLRVRQEGALAVVEVEDNGPGIAEADRPRVFERFVRATTEGSGCGLGLAIVKEIVERHAGRVRLEAVLPHGVRVRVELPRAGAGLEAFRASR